jgi:6-pyruvoyltetrahydropterin/6-carboxytetrahydropterin synthase
MYRIEKTFEVSASHLLELDYESKCSQNHGHNWIIKIFLKSKKLNTNGMVLDFTEIKRKIHDKIDHKDLNAIFDFSPTAENMAKWICDQFDCCYQVRVQESTNNIAWYIDEK